MCEGSAFSVFVAVSRRQLLWYEAHDVELSPGRDVFKDVEVTDLILADAAAVKGRDQPRAALVIGCAGSEFHGMRIRRGPTGARCSGDARRPTQACDA